MRTRIPSSTRPLVAIVVALTLLAPAVHAQGDDPPTRDEALARAIGGWLELPDEPYGRVWAAIGRETEPRSPGEALELLGGDPFARGETWQRWADTLARVTGAGADASPEDRIVLALAAAGHGRQDDAWRWLASVGPGHPEHVAGVLAYFLPGVPSDTALGPGGRPAGLDADALLAPLAPPRDPAAPSWRVEWREARFYDLRIGDVRTDGVVKIEGTGSEVRLLPREGSPSRTRVLLPGEVGVDVSSRYVDWERQPEELGAILPVVLTPATGAEGEPEDAGEHVLWGRFRERKEQRPALPGESRELAQLRLGGLALCPEPGSSAAELELAAEASQALGTLLGIEVRVAPPGARHAGPFAPIEVHVPPGPAGAEKLAWLASMIERRLASRQ